LGNEKVLKTLIGFHAKGEEQAYMQQIDTIRNRLDYLNTQRVEVVCKANATQSVVD